MKYLLLLILLVPSTVQSQILNIERYRIEKDTLKPVLLKTTAGLNVFNRSAAENAPVNLFGYNVDLNLLYYPRRHAYTLIAKIDYLRINENDFLNFGFIHGRMSFFRASPLHAEVFSQYSFDNFRGLAPRIVLGAGGRRKLLANSNLTLALGMGLMYEHEQWLHPVSESTVAVTFLKSTNYISLRLSVNDYVDLNTINYYQVGYDRGIARYRSRYSSLTTLNTKLSRRLSLTNSLELNYEDRPIVPITRLIFAFRTGISLDL